MAEHLLRESRATGPAEADGLHLHDVWELDRPLPAGVDLDELAARLREARLPFVVRILFALRSAAGKGLRLDRGATGFRPLHASPSERLYRIRNATVTALLHVSVVDHRVRLAVYVRPHGWRGRLYLRAIGPARRYVLYPALIRWAGRRLAAGR